MSGRLPIHLRQTLIGTLVLAVPLVAVAGWGATAGGSTANTAVLVLLNVVLAVGLQTYSGNSGTVSFAPMVFAAAGAYTAGLLTMPVALKSYFSGLPDWLSSTTLGLFPAVLAAICLATVVGLVTAAVGSRLSGAPAVVATLALLLASNVVLVGWTDVTHGAGGLTPIPRLTTVWLAAGAAVAAVAGSLAFRFSSWGIQVRASQTDATAALASGVRVGAVRVSAWLISAAIAGLGGALLATHLGAVTPSMFYLSSTFSLIAMVIVGGLSTVTGAVCGAVAVTLLQQLLRPVEDLPLTLGPLHLDRLTGLVQVVLVLLFLLVMYFRPAGLAGGLEIGERVEARLPRRGTVVAEPIAVITANTPAASTRPSRQGPPRDISRPVAERPAD